MFVDKKRRLPHKRKDRSLQGKKGPRLFPGAGKRAGLKVDGVGHGVNAKPGWDLSLAGVRNWVASCDGKAEQLCPSFKVAAKTEVACLWFGLQQSH